MRGQPILQDGYLKIRIRHNPTIVMPVKGVKTDYWRHKDIANLVTFLFALGIPMNCEQRP